MSERKKTTYHLDAGIVRATKVAAAREDKAEYQVVEDALRRYLGLDLLERIRAKAHMNEEEAMALTVREVDAVRAKEKRVRRKEGAPGSGTRRSRR
ncbi:MAG TPA: hypothetical protein VGB83_00970 [Actinomycetota bacterium]